MEESCEYLTYINKQRFDGREPLEIDFQTIHMKALRFLHSSSYFCLVYEWNIGFILPEIICSCHCIGTYTCKLYCGSLSFQHRMGTKKQNTFFVIKIFLIVKNIANYNFYKYQRLLTTMQLLKK